MKQFFSFLAIIVSFSACTKNAIVEPPVETQTPKILSSEIPVNFTYSSPKCERPEIIFTGETYSDVTTITSDSTVNLRDDQQYKVTFRLRAERCSAGEIILGGENADEVNFWLGTYPGSAEKAHVNLESKYFVVVLGE
ncbi:MAG: hypothetical protein ACJ75F_01575 [Flavisolibacter sp.]|jgi:hypothetical protein